MAVPVATSVQCERTKNDFLLKKNARMAQRWPWVSRPARDARMPCAPARGAPAVSAPEARRPVPRARVRAAQLSAASLVG
eukprot:4806637-Prymnesium_polylepis.1